jgi:hypothetical protein
MTDPWANPTEPWFGNDKWKHFGACFIISVVGYCLAAAMKQRLWIKLASGGTMALFAGIG